jgi:hypothetical protein
MDLSAMKRECTEADRRRARDWYVAHKPHVDRLVKGSDQKPYPASGSDISRPELWKPEHWKWFNKET